jgi:hypothetical protein
MATLAKKIEVEQRARQMLEREGIPAPDRIEYGFGCVRLFWAESKTVLVIDIDDPCEVDASRPGVGGAEIDMDKHVIGGDGAVFRALDPYDVEADGGLELD